ncbi:MAG: hypothetical protein SNH27_07420 [Rikenellaceae bacterium]
MKRRAYAEFSNSKGTVSIATYRKGKRKAIKFWSVSRALNYCKEHRIVARMRTIA